MDESLPAAVAAARTRARATCDALATDTRFQAKMDAVVEQLILADEARAQPCRRRSVGERTSHQGEGDRIPPSDGATPCPAVRARALVGSWDPRPAARLRSRLSLVVAPFCAARLRGRPADGQRDDLQRAGARRPDPLRHRRARAPLGPLSPTPWTFGHRSLASPARTRRCASRRVGRHACALRRAEPGVSLARVSACVRRMCGHLAQRSPLARRSLFAFRSAISCTLRLRTRAHVTGGDY